MPDHPHKPTIVTQVSPWRDPTHTILLTFTEVGSPIPLVRVIVTNQNPNLKGSKYTFDTEYWHAAKSLPKGRPLAMTFTHACWKLAEVDRYADLPLAFSAAQDAKGLWTETRSAPSTEVTRHAFMAPDPDDDDHVLQIGLALLFTADGLGQIVWYKSSEPSTGYVWHDGTSPVKGLTWSPVESLDALGWSFAQGRATAPR